MSASWINALNKSDSRLHKEDIIRQALEASVLGNDNSKIFLSMLSHCYNPYLTYGVKKIPETVGIFGAENPWNEFEILLGMLANRDLSGHAARDAIQEMSERFDSVEWNTFLAPVLRRDMRCGISSTTINKICQKTDYKIPIFSCQLATNSEGRPEMKGIKRLEPKLDGVRVLMVATISDFGGIVTSFSRNGKTFENFVHIQDQITAELANIMKTSPHLLANGIVFDGEVVGNSFQELMRQARRKTDVQNDDSVYHIFDIIPLDDFKRGFWNSQLNKRIAMLTNIQPVIDKMPNVELLPHIEVNLDEDAGVEALQTYASEMVTAGFEGIMIKDLEAPYECKRSVSWMKWKPTITVDLEVIGLEEGTGRNKGRLGALVCNGVDDGKEITVNAGSGFSDAERESLWEDRNMIFGRTVEIMADAITQNQDGTYSLRFPRFVRFRDDKA